MAMRLAIAGRDKQSLYEKGKSGFYEKRLWLMVVIKKSFI